MDFRWAYKSAATVFFDVVSRVPGGMWDEPGLGGWSVRELVGHAASSGLRQVHETLTVPATSMAVTSPEAYWVFGRTAPAELVAVARSASDEDARKTAAELGDDPADTVAAMVRGATAVLASAGDDDVVTTPIGGMRVRDWLATRTFELVVHGGDVARAAGIPVEFAPEVVSFAADMAARVAIATGDGSTLLDALTGRGTLPSGFSVV
jgi:uncharacterized protein (TIGR03083 family)